MSDVLKGRPGKLYGPSLRPVKYSSSGTRYTGLNHFQQGAEVNEVNKAPTPMPGEVPNNWQAMNVRSGVNKTDCPSVFGIDSNRGMDKIGRAVFTPDFIKSGWRRIKGEPVE